MSLSDDNRQRQQDEIIALQAIFGESAVELGDSAEHISYILVAPLDSIEAEIKICFHLPATYPSDDPPIFEWVGATDTRANSAANDKAGFIYPQRQLNLSSDMHSAIEQELRRMWDEDMCREVVIFSWISWLDGYFSENWPQPLDPIALPKDGAAKTKKTDDKGYSSPTSPSEDALDTSASGLFNIGSHRNANGGNTVQVPEIYTGAPLEMKKSVFVAHVARVKNTKDVDSVRDRLMQDKKIAQATHNILAYRIQMENGSINQDNDDDGETAAGKRLAHLLQLLEVTNVMVIVTRWYGGTHLGPDRFKLINNAARQALESGGFINEQRK